MSSLHELRRCFQPNSLQHSLSWGVSGAGTNRMACQRARRRPPSSCSFPGLGPSVHQNRCYSERALDGDGLFDFRLLLNLGLHPPPFGRMDQRVNAVDLALMPPGPALTLRLRRVLLVLAVLAVDGSEPFAGP